MNKCVSQPKGSSKKNITLVLKIPTRFITVVAPILGVMLVIVTLLTLGVLQPREASAQGDFPATPLDVGTFTSAGTLNFQGELRDLSSGIPLIDGDYKMHFAIYDADTVGTRLWPAPSPDYEEHIAVSLEDGLFNVMLGSYIPIPGSVFENGGNRYLQIWVCPTAGIGCTVFEDLGRLPISSVGYAKAFIPGTSVSGTGMVLGLSSSTTDGSVLNISASASTGNAAGVYASSSAPSGAGLSGYNASSGYGVFGGSVNGTGVYGTAPGTGVSGVSTASSGENYGVYGRNNSQEGAGVYGESYNSDGVGVHGENTFGVGTGVRGDSAGGAGVHGTSVSGAGVYGTASIIGTSGVATGQSGTNYGVFGQNNSEGGAGVYGESNHVSGTGVYGSSTSGTGVHGTSAISGTVGIATDPSGPSYGVYGQNASATGAGVYGSSTHPDGLGVYSDGNMNVDGDLLVEGDLNWTPMTSYLSVPAAAFRPSDNSLAYHNDGYMLWHEGSGLVENKKAFFTPVSLPHQGYLRNISVQVCTTYGTAPGKFELRLLRYDLNAGYLAGPSEIAFIYSSVWSSFNSCEIFSTDAFTPDTIDNSQYAYYLGVWMVGNRDNPDPDPYMSLHDVVIEYSISRPY